MGSYIKVKIVCFILAFFVTPFAFGQDKKIDSLRTVLGKSKNDTVSIDLLLKIGNAFKEFQSDSALSYYKMASDIAERNSKKSSGELNKKYLKQQATAYRFSGNVYLNLGSYVEARLNYSTAIELFNRIDDYEGASACYSNTGMTFSRQGEYEKALSYYNRSLAIAKKHNDKKIISLCYTNIGIVYDEQGNYDIALDHYLKALKIDEETGDKTRLPGDYSNIGIIYKNQGLYEKAIEYYNKALNLYEESGQQSQLSNCLNNIGNVYSEKKDYDLALEYYSKALKINEETGDRYGLSATLSNFGNVYQYRGEYAKVLDYYTRSLEIKKEIGDSYGMALLYTNLASLYIDLTDSVAHTAQQRSHYLDLSLEYGLLSYSMAIEMQVIPWVNSAARTLMAAYKKQGKFKEALEYAAIYISTRDTLISDEQTRVLAEMESIYENEKKQLLIDKMQSQKELDNKTIQNQQIIIGSVIAGLIIILVFSVIIFRMFRQKRKANILLARQNTEIMQQKEEILTQRDEIIMQRDILHSQKKEITDSITYALQIQQAMLPDMNSVLGLRSVEGNIQYPDISDSAFSVSGYFILYKPKDIVSGDFYWATRVNEWLLLTVADCTGHGVPGAFMSMLGISFLNEIVRKKEITDAAMVLNNLRSSVIESLKQQKGFSSDSAGSVKDGMDMVFCALNTKTLELQFAGANNPLYLVTGCSSLVTGEANQKPETSNQQLTELKGDKMPIGIHERMQPFVMHKLMLRKGDMIYLTSDGFADQYGGKSEKKFMVKNLREKLFEISSKTLAEQKEELNRIFDDWKAGRKQIDDVTIMGIRI